MDISQYLRDAIELPLGGDYYETVTFYQDDEVTPEDTTDYGMTVVIFAASNGEVYETLSVENGRIIATPASGQFKLTWTPAQIEALEFKTAKFRATVEYADGTKQTFWLGTVKVVGS